MSASTQRKIYVALLGLVLAVLIAAPAYAAEEPPYEADPTLSLLGDCETIASVDPIPDPSCPYPPPPAGPSGRFEKPRPVAVDPHGNEYVLSWADGEDAKGRVDVFDDEGRFLTEANVPDPKTAAVDSEGNLYVFEELGDVVRYEPSEYEFDEEAEQWKIEYGNAPVLVASGAFQGSVAVDAANDQLLIAREGKIFRYKSADDAEPNGLIATYSPAGLSWTEAMAVDAQRRRIYVSFCAKGNEECGVKVLDADNPEEVLETIDGSTVPAGKFAAFSGRLPIAVDEGTGDFFIADSPLKMIYRFSEGYEFLSQQEFKEMQTGSKLAVSNGTQSPTAEVCDYPTDPVPPPGDACNRHYLFVTVFTSKGRLAALRPSNQGTPVIEGVATAGIGETEAELKATIFPRGLATEYQFEITTQEAWEAETEKFENATVLPGGTIPAESLPTEVSVFATGLTPGQTYRFRVVAENELGPADEEGQNESTFATYDDALIAQGCPNEALRVGLSALLPDCRAYELVTPPDTSGRPPKGTAFLGSMFSTLQASPAGEAVSFTIEGGSLPGGSGVGSFSGDPYVARRNGTGWSTELAGPTGEETTQSAPGSSSPDKGYSFWRSLGEGPLGPVGSIYAEYFRYPDGHSEPIGRGSEGVDPTAKGDLITENGTHVIFETGSEASTTPVQLEPNAPPDGTAAVYDRTIDPITGEEKTHVVSLLPGDETPEANEDAVYRGASADGEGIAFSISTSPFTIGTVYLRVGNETTYEIGEEVEFAGISEGGERMFYLEEGDLKALDTTTPAPEVVEFTSTGDVTPVNVSTDGTRAYFVSPSTLGGANPQGDVAQAGEQNLYLSEEGSISFVATVTDRDVEGEVPPFEATFTDGLGLWTEVAAKQPAKDPSRLNPDGSVLLFQSRANITGYPASEFPQIYRYDSDAGELRCISCIPTGVKATGGASLENYTFDTFTPKPFSPFAFVPNLTPDGNRVFFDSTEALVSGDTDGVTDVYEWEAQGVGSCTQAGGCVYLISSGQSEVDNYLYGHSTDGRDVFFTTGDRLTGWDSAGGAISIYDARVNGGYPEPGKGDVCVGDGCRPQVSPAPALPVPAVPAHGADDQIKPKKSKTCPKGKRKVKKNGKVRCVSKKKHKKHKGRGASRGASK
jgi:hypothetical protein